jgi:hypothetical protein
VGLVLGQHHRASGQPGNRLPQGGKDLVAVGVAVGDQAGPPPPGDLAGRQISDLPAEGQRLARERLAQGS